MLPPGPGARLEPEAVIYPSWYACSPKKRLQYISTYIYMYIYFFIFVFIHLCVCIYICGVYSYLFLHLYLD